MNMNRNPILSEEGKTAVETEESRVEARRNFLKTAGKFALYTPPAVAILMNPSTRAIANSGGVGGAAGLMAPGGRPRR